MLKKEKELGKKGEEMAAEHLRAAGYTILVRNWRYYHLELDIVAKQGDELVIVEVKTRIGEQYGHPSEAITKGKINRLIDAAEAYIIEHDSALETRFDVITVVLCQGKYELKHFEDAFIPGM